MNLRTSFPIVFLPGKTKKNKRQPSSLCEGQRLDECCQWHWRPLSIIIVLGQLYQKQLSELEGISCGYPIEFYQL